MRKEKKKSFPCSDRNCETCFYAAICNPEIADDYREMKEEERYVYERDS